MSTLGVATVPRTRVEMPQTRSLVEEMRRAIPGIRIYNPSPEWFVPQVGGIFHWMPPDLGGEQRIEDPRYPGQEDKKVVANGEYEVKDRYGLARDGSEVACETGMTVVTFLCRKYQARGIVWLTNKNDEASQKIDRARKAAARKIYYKFKRAEMEAEIAARADFIEKWQKNPKTKGLPLPPPTDRQLRAQEFLDAIMVQEKSERDKQYVCQCGFWEGDDFGAYQRHMMAQHGQKVEEPKAAEKLTADPGGKRRPRAVDPIPDVGPKGAAGEQTNLVDDVVASSLGENPDQVDGTLSAALSSQAAARAAKAGRG